MDQATYTYNQLAIQNDNFTAPGFDITLDGKELSPVQFHIPNVEVELNGNGTAGGCSFKIEGQYDYEKSKWINDATKLVKAGATLAVNGGYKKRKELFYGYVDDFSMEFTHEGTPFISVNGLDGLGYLMNMHETVYAGEKKAKDIIEAVLNKSKSAGFAKKVTIGTIDPKKFQTPIVKEQVDDWTFLCMMAERYGATLMAVDGELIFDDVLTRKSPIVTLELGKSLRRFSKRVSLAHQVGKVEVFGRDVNQKAVSGSANKVTVGGTGKTASEWVSGLKDSVLRERSEFAQTEQECQLLAQHRFNSLSMGFVSGEGECIGIPELIPGRYIKIEGTDKETGGTYFISRVFHRFSEEGYITSFEVKGAKA